ncbi:type II toxin-antitoxin system PemK/MazF family toxin [Sphaerisporangium fuscum]|uniref:type II toxin-antitoxin system PemK/MazF family toxin n=1 Tax=Sphaerisporangium fuscum TaxID=2835868 RepID=UPI0027E3A407|nr:type II toxin-antitoxin system PemK/MazF family toxin [Sphaerisporangium fuscum]
MRGDVYRLRTAMDAVGHEQRGERFAVLLQSDALTSSELNGKATRVLVDQLKAVDTSRLGDFAGRLDPAEMEEIDEALHVMLGLLT